MKKIFIKTFGCQMNVRDSEFVTGILFEDGFRKVDSPDKADIILFNSCSVRKHAEDRLFSNIADLKTLKKNKPGMVIGLIGCTAQQYKAKAFERSRLIDFVCGPGNEHELPGIIREVSKNRCAIIAVDKVSVARPEKFPSYRAQPFKSYVSIGEGCNNFCSYCIVPYVRGRERSRKTSDILRECRQLADLGCKEITLLGQNVNSFGKKLLAFSCQPSAKKTDFIRLLEKINSIKGIRRIRFMTSHPKDASPELFEAMRDLENVCEHLHLPLQSGSDRILKLMNRGYTLKHYLKLIESYRKILPGGSLTTDIIVGFPSEHDRDFEKTRKIMKTTGFDGAFVFNYSARPPAKASGLKDDVPKEEKTRRITTLIAIQCAISLEKNLSMQGKMCEVLVDGCHDNERGMLTGRTRTNKVVIFKADKRLVGKFADVIIESASPHALKGRIS